MIIRPMVYIFLVREDSQTDETHFKNMFEIYRRSAKIQTFLQRVELVITCCQVETNINTRNFG